MPRGTHLCTRRGAAQWWSMSVASRRRTYTTRVKRIVADWEAANEQHTISWLAEHPLNAAQFGLSDAEVVTIRNVAGNLRDFAAHEQLLGPDGEDAACRLWADECGELEHAPRLDPVVGTVKGIGLALFAYMRMRSGADAMKPDSRVKQALRKLGFVVPDDDHAVLILAKAAATEIVVSRLVLDQLLWWSRGQAEQREDAGAVRGAARSRQLRVVERASLFRHGSVYVRHRGATGISPDLFVPNGPTSALSKAVLLVGWASRRLAARDEADREPGRH